RPGRRQRDHRHPGHRGTRSRPARSPPLVRRGRHPGRADRPRTRRAVAAPSAPPRRDGDAAAGRPRDRRGSPARAPGAPSARGGRVQGVLLDLVGHRAPLPGGPLRGACARDDDGGVPGRHLARRGARALAPGASRRVPRRVRLGEVRALRPDPRRQRARVRGRRTVRRRHRGARARARGGRCPCGWLIPGSCCCSGRSSCCCPGGGPTGLRRCGIPPSTCCGRAPPPAPARGARTPAPRPPAAPGPPRARRPRPPPGLARPQLGPAEPWVHREGVDVVLAVDVSGSMLAEDFTIDGKRTNRLDAVKDVVRQFVADRPQDRIGLVLFAGRPYTQAPLTLDHGWLLQNLPRASGGMIEDGTAIGSALAAATNRLRASTAPSKFIVLLTDGQSNAGNITTETAAEAAGALRIKVYTVGAGTRGMAPFPMKDFFGNTVYRPMQVDIDEPTLET